MRFFVSAVAVGGGRRWLIHCEYPPSKLGPDRPNDSTIQRNGFVLRGRAGNAFEGFRWSLMEPDSGQWWERHSCLIDEAGKTGARDVRAVLKINRNWPTG
jgi:hypothetical protein